MSIEQALVTLIKASAEYQSAAAGRIYPAVLPQGVTLPATTYDLISANRVQSHRGLSGATSARYQFTVFASTRGAAETVANILITALVGERLTVGDVFISGMYFADDSERADYDPDTQWHRRMFDIYALYGSIT